MALLIVKHCKGEHLKTVGCELAVEKAVDQVDLDTAVGQVHYLAEHKPGGGLECNGYNYYKNNLPEAVHNVASFIAVEVFCNSSSVLLLCVFRSYRGNYPRNETFHFLAFPGLPEEVRHVEGERLHEEGHPHLVNIDDQCRGLLGN